MFEVTMTGEEIRFEQEFAGELAWLVRFCTGLTGDRAEAEDLAQETLTSAWLHADSLQDQTKRKAWLAAIARNRWRDWARRQQKLATTAQLKIEEYQGAELDSELEQAEIVELVEQALATLSPETRTALVLHFIEERPLAEIAARLHTSEGAVSMRLQRGKATLKSLLATDLVQEAAPNELKKTRIWCPYCGRNYLEGRFQPDHGGIELRCPQCNSRPGELITQSNNLGHILKGVSGLKPAWTRIGRLVHRYLTPILAEGRGHCMTCGHPVQPQLGLPGPTWGPPSLDVQVDCPACRFHDNDSLEMLLLAHPEGQSFWATHPRFEARPVYQVEAEGRPVYMKEFAGVGETAGLTGLFDAKTMVLWRVYRT